eukprot:scaffold1418_cov352-Prasinococcus_capsulatus_cf.AAC.10
MAVLPNHGITLVAESRATLDKVPPSYVNSDEGLGPYRFWLCIWNPCHGFAPEYEPRKALDLKDPGDSLPAMPRQDG